MRSSDCGISRLAVGPEFDRAGVRHQIPPSKLPPDQASNAPRRVRRPTGKERAGHTCDTAVRPREPPSWPGSPARLENRLPSVPRLLPHASTRLRSRDTQLSILSMPGEPARGSTIGVEKSPSKIAETRRFKSGEFWRRILAAIYCAIYLRTFGRPRGGFPNRSFLTRLSKSRGTCFAGNACLASAIRWLSDAWPFASIKAFRSA